MAGWSYLLCSLDHECRPFDDFANWTITSPGTNLRVRNNTNNGTNHSSSFNHKEPELITPENDELELPLTLRPS